MLKILDIVFQSGEFINPDKSWITDLIINIVGAAIGAGATMGALYLSFKNDRKNDEKRRLKLQQEKVKYFRSLILSSIKQVQQQIDGLKEFKKAVDTNPFLLPLLPQSAQNDLLRLVHRINQEDYFHAYLGQFIETNEIIEEFRKIYGYLDYFDSQIKLTQDSLWRSAEFDHNRKISLRKIIEDNQDHTASILINPAFAGQNEMLLLINKTLEDFHKEKANDSDLLYAHEKYVVPLKKGLIQYVNSSPEIAGLLTELRKATYLITEIKMQNSYLATDFENDSNNLSGHLSDFKIVIQRLTNFQEPTLT